MIFFNQLIFFLEPFLKFEETLLKWRAYNLELTFYNQMKLTEPNKSLWKRLHSLLPLHFVRYIRWWSWGLLISWCCWAAVHFSRDGPRVVFEWEQTRIMRQARDPRRSKHDYRKPRHDPRKPDQDKCRWSKQSSGGHHRFFGVAAIRLLNACVFAVCMLSTRPIQIDRSFILYRHA